MRRFSEIGRKFPDKFIGFPRTNEPEDVLSYEAERIRRCSKPSGLSRDVLVSRPLQDFIIEPVHLLLRKPVPLVRDLTRAYGDTYPQYQFACATKLETAPLEGSPELMAQLLDKLVDNARSFTPPGGRISLGLERHAQLNVLWVRNEGSQLPDGLAHQLFDSLVSQRSKEHKGEAPHLGLGLFIVRLIAEAHGGQVQACNLADGSGVQFSVSLPV